jgi:DNA polymerase III subunit epsilon
MLIHQTRFTAIDFESAGAARGMNDSPVQIGLATWSVNHGHQNPFVSYLYTDQPIHWSAQKVHGISSAELTDAPSLLSLWPEIKTGLSGAIIVAHGKGTEKRFLRAFPGHGFGPWIDTLHLSRAAWPELSSHSLGALCEARNLTETIQSLVPSKNWHDALFDSVASLVVLADLIETFQLAAEPVETLLHPDTSAWHRLRRP